MAYDIGPKIGIEGEKEFRSAITQINTSMKTLGTEMQKVTSQFDKNDKSTESLTAKNKVLTKQISEQKNKLTELEKGLSASTDKYGENDKVTQRWQQSVNKATAELNNMERELENNNRDLDTLAKESEDARSNLKKLAEQFTKTGESMKAIGEKMTDIGKNLSMKVTAPLTGLGVIIAKTGADFEAALSEVGAISGATGDDLEALEAKAKEMGASTKFSASESAEALKYMAMAGWDTNKMLDGLPGVMNLAAAAGEELGTVSDILTDAMTAFGMEASRAGEFADTLAAASSKSNTNVGLLGESFKYVAPLAGALGYESKDAAIALGLMANAGIKGSQSGTAMRSILTRLAKPTKESGTAMDMLGISITNADGTMKSLAEIMEDLRAAFKDLEPDQQAVFAAQIAGQEAMSGLLSIVNTGEEDFRNLSDAINNSTGASQEMADMMQDNLAGRLTILKSGIEGVALQLYDVLQPSLEKVVAVIQKLVDWFSNLSPEMQTTIVVVAGVAAAIGPLLVGLGIMISSVGAIASALPLLGAAFTVVTGPIGLVVAAVVAAIAIGVLLYKNWDEIKAKATELKANISQKFGEIKKAIVDPVNNAIDTLKNIDLREIGRNIIQGLIDGITAMVQKVKDAVSNIAGAVTGKIKSALKISSPSKVMVEMGKFTGEGFAQGIQSTLEEVSKQSNLIAKSAIPTEGQTVKQVVNQPKQELHLHIGTLIADDYGLKQLERKLKGIRISESARLGEVT